MTYIYKLAGENLGLAEAEINGFLSSQDIGETVSRIGRLAFSDSQPQQLRRLALCHEVSKEIDIDSFAPKKKYAVEAENLTDKEFESREVEKRIGEEISNPDNEVDLEEPETIIKVYKTKDRLIYGKVVEDIQRGLFEERSNEKRPFSSPISMNPVLARVLVNLSGVSPGKRVLDPFCGTGGILIEAGLCGIGVCGADIQGSMVEGCRKNLNEYGIINHDICQADISEVEEIFENYNAVISDLPYGKASKEEETPVETFLEFIEGFEGRTIFMYNESSIEEYEAEYEVYVHNSLTRYIFIV